MVWLWPVHSFTSEGGDRRDGHSFRLPSVVLGLLFVFPLACEPGDAVQKKSGGNREPSSNVENQKEGSSVENSEASAVPRARQRACQWLVRHQSPDGAWRGNRFTRQCPPDDQCSGRGFDTHDGALTGLVVLALQQCGDRLRADGRQALRMGLEWLRRRLKADGTWTFGREGKPYFARSLGALVLLRTDRLQIPADHLRRMKASLREELRAVRVERASATLPECVVPWYHAALTSGPDRPSSLPAELHRKMTAIVEQALESGWSTTPAVRGIKLWLRMKQSKRNSERMEGIPLPTSLREEPMSDPYALYFWTQVLQEYGNSEDQRMANHLQSMLQQQRTSGHRNGSWDPSGTWGPTGGRLFFTAMMLLVLSVYP